MKSFKNVPLLLRGWVLDLLPARDGMEVWFRTAAGETVTLFAPFRPSFALAGLGVRESPVRTAARRWGCGLRGSEGIEFFSGKTVPAWTLAVPAPSLLPATVRQAESAFGPEALFNAHIPPPPLSRAFLRTEGTGHPAHGRTQPLAFSADGTTHVLCWEDGTQFLREFLRLLDAADPDLLVTEYGERL